MLQHAVEKMAKLIAGRNKPNGQVSRFLSNKHLLLILVLIQHIYDRLFSCGHRQKNS